MYHWFSYDVLVLTFNEYQWSFQKYLEWFIILHVCYPLSFLFVLFSYMSNVHFSTRPLWVDSPIFGWLFGELHPGLHQQPCGHKVEGVDCLAVPCSLHVREGWNLKSLPTQAIQWLYDSNFLLWYLRLKPLSVHFLMNIYWTVQ